MKAFHFSLLRILLVVAVAALAVSAQDKKEPSSGEVEAVKKINAAKDLPAKFKAAEEFMKKNSKSSLRPKVADYLVGQIGDVTDGAQRQAAIETYLKMFSSDSEKDLILPAQVDALALVDKVDEAFKLAPKAFEKSPDNVILLTQLALKGGAQAAQNQTQNAELTKQYGTKAIALIEADKKPAGATDDFWNNFKKQWVPELYQALGFVAFATKDEAETKVNFQKVIDLNPTNPRSYYVLGNIADNEYQHAAVDYNGASGAAKAELLKKAEVIMDQAIDYFAHVVGLTEGKAEFKPVHDQVLPVLQEYYKYRKGSLTGLDQLIAKYKK